MREVSRSHGITSVKYAVRSYNIVQEDGIFHL